MKKLILLSFVILAACLGEDDPAPATDKFVGKYEFLNDKLGVEVKIVKSDGVYQLTSWSNVIYRSCTEPQCAWESTIAEDLEISESGFVFRGSNFDVQFINVQTKDNSASATLKLISGSSSIYEVPSASMTFTKD